LIKIISKIFFADLEITPATLKQLSNAILKADLDIYFACYARPGKGLNYDVLKAAHQAGCRFLLLGVESLSDQFLEFCNKGTTADSIRNILKNGNDLNIGIMAFMLCGIPTQTRKEIIDDMKKIAKLQKKHNIYFVNYALFNLGKHMRFFIEREKYGIDIISRRKLFSFGEGKNVHTDEWLEFKYKDKNAYDFLVKRKYHSDDSLYVNAAICALSDQTKKFKLNKKYNSFFSVIINFLFENQLLYMRQR